IMKTLNYIIPLIFVFITNFSYATIQVLNITPISFCGANDGAVQIEASGTAGPFMFLWSGPGGFSSTNQNISNLSLPGIYSVTVTNFIGCKTYLNANVTCSAALENETTIVKPSCFGANNGSIFIDLKGSATLALYQWSNGSTSNPVINLAPGNYSVTVTTDCGLSSACTGIFEFEIEESDQIQVQGSAISSTCQESNASIDVTVSGGVPPYSYFWSTGATTEDLQNIPAGIYGLTVTDQIGCTQNYYTLIYNIGDLPLVSANIVPSCNSTNSGSTNLSVTPQAVFGPPYTFEWTNGATSEDISDLLPGQYCVTITDVYDCPWIKCYQVPNTAISLMAEIIHTCKPTDQTGGIYLNMIGGQYPYTYNWSNGATTKDITNLLPGNYCVTVTDNEGCTTIKCFQVKSFESDIHIVDVTNPSFCYGNSPESNCTGSIEIEVIGNNGPYTYSWSGPNGFTSTSEDITELCPGVYRISVTNESGCTASKTVDICCCE